MRWTGTSAGISPSRGTVSSSRASRAVGDLVGRPHDEDPRLGQRAPQLEPLVDRGDAEHGRAGLERRAPDIDRAVPVAVRLDDGPELRAVERLEQPASVVPDRAEVDRDLAAMHCPPA